MRILHGCVPPFPLYHRHRFPAEIISHCVWLYFRFVLSFRDVEEMLAMRGVALTYETVGELKLRIFLLQQPGSAFRYSGKA